MTGDVFVRYNIFYLTRIGIFISACGDHLRHLVDVTLSSPALSVHNYSAVGDEKYVMKRN